jgi:hypothetical protein
MTVSSEIQVPKNQESNNKRSRAPKRLIIGTGLAGLIFLSTTTGAYAGFLSNIPIIGGVLDNLVGSIFGPVGQMFEAVISGVATKGFAGLLLDIAGDIGLPLPDVIEDTLSTIAEKDGRTTNLTASAYNAVGLGKADAGSAISQAFLSTKGQQSTKGINDSITKSLSSGGELVQSSQGKNITQEILKDTNSLLHLQTTVTAAGLSKLDQTNALIAGNGQVEKAILEEVKAIRNGKESVADANQYGLGVNTGTNRAFFGGLKKGGSSGSSSSGSGTTTVPTTIPNTPTLGN